MTNQLLVAVRPLHLPVPSALLTAFTARLRDKIDLDSLQREILWLRRGDDAATPGR
jgi:hypothetical protein